jgi:hypothetical protein
MLEDELLVGETKTEVLAAADLVRVLRGNTIGNRQDALAKGRKELSFADRTAHTGPKLRCVGERPMIEQRR